MSWKSFRALPLALVCASVFSGMHAYADAPLLSEVRTVALAGAVVPAEHAFSVSSADSYTLTLTDFGATGPTPVPLKSVKLAVTSGATIAATLDAAGSATFAIPAGDYVIHVVGTLGDPGSGGVGIHIADSDNNTLYDFSDNLSPPAGAIPLSGSGIDDTFTVPASGNFQVTLSDLQLPQPLGTLTLAIVQDGGSVVTTLAAAGSTAVSLQSNVTYRLFAVGNNNIDPSDPNSANVLNAGLFGVNVTPAGGTAPVYSKAVPVGEVTLLGSPMLAAGSYTLTASDLQLPGGLQQFGTVVALNGQSVASLNTTGNQILTATAGTYQVFGLGVVPAGGTGSYAVSLQTGQTAALSLARAVVDKSSTMRAYSFDTVLATGQTYAFDIADFGYPSPFASLNTAVIQGGALVTGSQLSIGTTVSNSPATGTANITPAAGPATILVFAQPATSTNTTNAAGLFGIDMTSGGSSVLTATQGVGQLFSVRRVTIAAAGHYQVTVGDVGFPSRFQELAAIVTRGTSKVGSIFGGGTFGFPAQPGDYEVNFLAQPDSGSAAGSGTGDAAGSFQAGTYSMVVETAPAPLLALSATPTSVSAGGTATLQWTGTNVTSCAASNGWSGSKAPTDTYTTPALTASTTYVLSCEGTGGSVSQSVTVTVNAASTPAKSGGGGAIRPEALLFLFGLLLLRRRMLSC